MITTPEIQPIVSHQPQDSASVQEWVDWFVTAFLPGWIERARDPAGFGFYDLLDEYAQPLQPHRRTVLAQARLLFTFSHLALLTKSPVFQDAARTSYDALTVFRKSPGGYCRARSGNTGPENIRHGKNGTTEDADDYLAFSYDQSFVILGLSTWGKLNPDSNIEATLEASWSYIESSLTDHTTGLLLEHDGLTDPTHHTAPHRAQNPHMHLYEASLQAYEMTKRPVWLERAKQMRSKGLEYFYDQTSGTVVEFIAPDLSNLNGREGQRREIGHQCEWAWLLYREAELGGDTDDYRHITDVADQLLAFADNHGFAVNGAMQGAAFDAVASDTSWREEKFLLWPQTEAIKTFAIRSTQPKYSVHANQLTNLMFQQYFADYAAFVNQLNKNGEPLWAEALSRLHYHIVLSLTEGARAGLWNIPE